MDGEKTDSESVVRIMTLITKIRLKLTSLGFSPQQVKDKVMQTLAKVYKLRCVSSTNLEKTIMAKLQSKNLNQKVYSRLIFQLDLLYNSVYDNFQSESQSAVKLEQIGVAIEADKAASPIQGKLMERRESAQGRHPRFPGRFYSKRPSFILRTELESSQELKRLLLRRRELQMQSKNMESFFPRRFDSNDTY